jgi:hypothetical protein
VLAAVAAGALFSGCASYHRAPHPDLARVWRSFLALPEERALMIAGDPRRDLWVVGASGGHASPEEAEDSARAECMQRRAQRRIQAACQLYAIGEEIVWVGPE